MSDFAGWLFQCSPDRFRIFAAVATGQPMDNWSAKQHREEIQPGDRAALWIAAGEPGYDPGVYAIGTVRSSDYHGVVDHRFWIGGSPEPSEFVDIDFDRNVFHYPVSKAVLINDPDFAHSAIIMMPRFTTARLSTAEWWAIERRVLAHGPTRRPQLALIKGAGKGGTGSA